MQEHLLRAFSRMRGPKQFFRVTFSSFSMIFFYIFPIASVFYPSCAAFFDIKRVRYLKIGDFVDNFRLQCC